MLFKSMTRDQCRPLAALAPRLDPSAVQREHRRHRRPGLQLSCSPSGSVQRKHQPTVEDGTLFFVSISLDQDALAHATRLQELLCNGHHPGVGRIQTVKGKESQEKVKEKQCKVKERQ